METSEQSFLLNKNLSMSILILIPILEKDLSITKNLITNQKKLLKILS